MQDAIIIGGGISGLATAYYLQEAAQAAGLPLAYTLLESDSRLGGKILTKQVGGFTIEGGPDCFLSQKPWAADLCRQLGIGDRLIGTNDDRRKVFVVNGGRLTPLPDGVMLIVPTRIMPFVTSTLISWPGKMRMGLEFFIPARARNGDESVGHFVRRRLGREALDKIAEPLMSGIHVSDPEEQSLLATFPRFRDLELKHGSLIKGMLARRPAPKPANGAGPSSLFITLRGGLGELPQALQGALVHGQVRTGVRVTGVRQHGAGYDVQTDDGASLRARVVILATPAYVSADLIATMSPALAGRLQGIRYVSTATVSIGFAAGSAPKALSLNGFGFVIPRREQQHISACTWTSTKFDYRAPAAAALLRSFVGGPGREDMVDLSDDEMLSRVKQDLQRLMKLEGLHSEPAVSEIFRWRKANPQYDVGHLDRVREMKDLAAAQPGLFLTGSAFEGVGVPDCVHQGQQAAEKALAYLRQELGRASCPPPLRGS